MEEEVKSSPEADVRPKMPSKEFQENLRLMKINWMIAIYNKRKAQLKKEGCLQLRLSM